MWIVKASAAAMAVASLVLCSGCYSAPIMPPVGYVFESVQAPITMLGSPTSSRRGEASASSLLGIIAWGDASSDAAMKNGHITTLNRLDYEFQNFLGVYQRFTTVAHGD